MPLVLGVLASGLFALVSLLTTLLIVSGSKSSDFPLGTFFGGLLLTIAGTCVATQLLVAMRSGPSLGVCDLCRKKKPTVSAGINRHIGAIILMFHKSIRGQFCKECISQVFWKYTLITLLFGWWGVVSLIVTPIVLINNTVVYVRSRLLANRC
jgi:hypothetical protein